MRGTPCLLQLFYIYFVLPAFGIRFDPFMAGVIGLSVNYSAYLSEVYRAGIIAVPRGQLEAAHALGMSRAKMMRLIILPQAIRVVVPPLGNYFISLFKDTSLVSIVTVKELMFTGQIIAATNFQYFTIFTIIGIIYLSLSYPGSLFVSYLERRMKVGYRRKPSRLIDKGGVADDPPGEDLQILRPSRRPAGCHARGRQGRGRLRHRPVGRRQIDHAPLHQSSRDA